MHVVCNNAGPGCGGLLELTTPGDCDWIIGVDLMGMIYGCQTFLPHIKAHGEGGHIVSTASVSGMIPVPGWAIHNAAKAGIIALSQTLAAELEGTSIGVSVLGVAEKVMHGIKENQLTIFSHPEWRSAFEEHYQRMLAAYPKA